MSNYASAQNCFIAAFPACGEVNCDYAIITLLLHAQYQLMVFSQLCNILMYMYDCRKLSFVLSKEISTHQRQSSRHETTIEIGYKTNRNDVNNTKIATDNVVVIYPAAINSHNGTYAKKNPGTMCFIKRLTD